MRRVALILLSFVTMYIGLNAKCHPVDYVDPFIGSVHCRWFFFTPAAVPFGMAKPSPSTDGHYGSKNGWQANGYDYRHGSIEGFVNYHEFQVGGVLMMPVTGQIRTVPGTLENPDEGYRSRIDKQKESASPGYYAVTLEDYGIRAELTATEHVAFHRYIFPASDSSHVIFDIGGRLGESGPVKDAEVTVTSDDRVEGYVYTYPDYVKKYNHGGLVKMYFSAEVDKKPVSFGTFIGKEVSEHVGHAEGIGCGAYLTFRTKEAEAITFKVGLSYTSVENARNNLSCEASGLSFDRAAARAEKVWNEMLSRITVQGGSKSDKIKFYTGFYHALLGRGLASDVCGTYPKSDGTVGQIPCGADGKPIHGHYNTDAIWGGCWNLTQLWSLICPNYYSDWISSQLLIYKDTGWLGDGIACGLWVSGVGTNFTGMSISSAYNCGIRDFDVPLAYEAVFKNETCWKDRPKGAGKIDLESFVKKGYSCYAPGALERDSSKFASSHVLEYSFTSYAAAQFARLLGKEDDCRVLTELSDNWKNIYDPSLKMFRSRDCSGDFVLDFDPLSSQAGFQEGNAVQYSFYVPHDPNSLINLIGEDDFNSRLDSIMTEARKNIFGGGKKINAFSGLTAIYNHGNQPCLYIPWLFNFSGAPHLTQKWVRAICNEFYGTEPVHGYGYGQDEDQGQLGAWYVLSSIGLFDVRGLVSPYPSFQIGSPLFDKVKIRLPSGRIFRIKSDKDSDSEIYIEKVKYNGKSLDRFEIPFSDVVKGGTLELKMTNEL